MADRPALRGLLVPIATNFDAVTGDLAPVPLRENARALLAALTGPEGQARFRAAGFAVG